MKDIAILGSTGSIGTQTLDAAKVLRCNVVGLAADSNVDLVEQQVLEFNVPYVAMENEQAALELSRRLNGKNVIGAVALDRPIVLSGKAGVLEIARLAEANTVVNALSGCAGLVPTVEAVKAGKHVALANKESLVAGGAFVMPFAKEKGVVIMPIDSEHSAIFQCLQGNDISGLNKIHLTASGGPFRTYTPEQLEKVTAADALRHPVWSMGQKITIDSATLMNKGLEVIEAMWLFGVGLNKIEVVVHPQSVVHSMVEFKDGSVLAQLGKPDMRLPILYALSYPNRVENSFSKLNLFEMQSLTFERPRRELFPCLSLAEAAITYGGNMPAVLNAANEAAVGLFLQNKIAFTQIAWLIESAMSAYDILNETSFTLETVVHYSGWAAEWVRNKIKEVVKCSL